MKWYEWILFASLGGGNLIDYKNNGSMVGGNGGGEGGESVLKKGSDLFQVNFSKVIIFIFISQLRQCYMFEHFYFVPQQFYTSNSFQVTKPVVILMA